MLSYQAGRLILPSKILAYGRVCKQTPLSLARNQKSLSDIQDTIRCLLDSRINEISIAVVKHVRSKNPLSEGLPKEVRRSHVQHHPCPRFVLTASHPAQADVGTSSSPEQISGSPPTGPRPIQDMLHSTTDRFSIDHYISAVLVDTSGQWTVKRVNSQWAGVDL